MALAGTSTNTAGLEAISKAIAQFADEKNISAISTLNGQMQQLAKAMGIKELPTLIAQLEKLKVITGAQAAELRKLNQSGGTSTIGKIGAAIGKLAIPTAAFTLATGAAVHMLERFVAKANPAAAFQFNRALDDLAGTMGQILTPVLEGVTVLIRAYADGLQGLRPALEPIMTGIGDMITALAPLMQSVMSMAGPALELIGFIIRDMVVPAVTILASALKDLVDFIKDAIEVITLGMVSFDRSEAKSSVGAAVRPASYSSNIEDIGKRTTLAALNQGGSGLSKDAQEITKNQNKTNDILEKIADKIGQMTGINTKAGSAGGNNIRPTTDPFARVALWMQKQLNDL